MDIKEVNRNDIKQLVEYTNQELAKGRTQENISKEDFNMSIDWLRKKLTSNGYKRILNEYVKMDQQIEGQESFINNINTEATQEPQEGEKVIKDINTPLENKPLKMANNKETTKQTTNIIQPKEEPKKAFNNEEVSKLDQLLKLDIEVLNKMINDYNTKQNTKCSIKINDTTTTVTSLRLNKELYSMVKDRAAAEKIGITDIMNKIMLDYLNK